VHLQVDRMMASGQLKFAVHSSISESSSESDNDQAADSAPSVGAFSGARLNSVQVTAAADDARSSSDDDDAARREEGGALPRPAWMDASSQDSSSIADARVQSIRDIIRVSVICSV